MHISRIHNIMFNAAVLLIMVLVCFDLSSCTSDDQEIVEQEKQEITFANPVISGLTRAENTPTPGTEVGVSGEITTYPKEERFIVIGKKYPRGQYWGWDDPSSLWEFEPTTNVNVEEQRDKVFYNSLLNTWKTKKLHFWEDDKDYTFAAYSPARVRNTATHQVNYDKTGLHIKGFTPEEDLSLQYDLMFSERIFGINKNNGQNIPGVGHEYNGVNIKFRHALSSIHFKVCVHPDILQSNPDLQKGDYQIESIFLKGFYKKGDFNEGITSEDNTDKTTYTAKADKQKWTISTAAENLNGVGYNFLPTTGIELEVPPSSATTSNDAAKDVKDPIYGGFSALLIPQPLEASAEVVIKWKKKTETEYKETSIKLKDYTPEWLMGYRYTYTISFSEDIIYFSPNIKEMTEDGIIVL